MSTKNRKEPILGELPHNDVRGVTKLLKQLRDPSRHWRKTSGRVVRKEKYESA